MATSEAVVDAHHVEESKGNVEESEKSTNDTVGELEDENVTEEENAEQEKNSEGEVTTTSINFHIQPKK